ncbi:hypothetical protein AB0M45_32880 [Nocardia sp. NPDC051787]|uniref:hypothetical protein n=1 Tax=Nocardia sp. NPDC051787 TaxID=3155415 RepID=UPI00343BA52C
MDSERTVGEVANLIVELGLVDQHTPKLQRLLTKDLDEPLSRYGHTDVSAVLGLLQELGILYTFDYKTFRGIGECTDDERREWYESELQSIAACSRGMVTITNVRLVEDDDGRWELEFKCNRTYQYWPIYPGYDDEDIEAGIVFASFVRHLPTGTVEKFCSVDPQILGVSGADVFGDPKALNRLGAHFGLTFIA